MVTLKLNQGTLLSSCFEFLSALRYLKNLKKLSQSAVQKWISACVNFSHFQLWQAKWRTLLNDIWIST